MLLVFEDNFPYPLVEPQNMFIYYIYSCKFLATDDFQDLIYIQQFKI